MTLMQNRPFQEKQTKLWLVNKEEEILKHPAWQGNMSAEEAENLLLGCPSYTYLLRRGEGEYHYYLSYVKQEKIVHQICVLEFSSQGWVYRNGISVSQTNLINLIPLAMYCRPDQCIPLHRSNR